MDCIPWELIEEIAKYYDAETLLSICATSSKYNKLCENVKVWRNIFLHAELDSNELRPGLPSKKYIHLYYNNKNIMENANVILNNLENGNYYNKSLLINPEEQKSGICFHFSNVLFNDIFNVQKMSDIIYGKNRQEKNIFINNANRIFQALENFQNEHEDEEDAYVIEDLIILKYDEDSKSFFIHYDIAEGHNDDNRQYVTRDIMKILIYNLLKNHIPLFDICGGINICKN